MSESFEHLPPDLRDIGEALAASRDLPDGHLLDRVERRVRQAAWPRFRGFLPGHSKRISAGMAAALAVFALTGGIAVACVGTGTSPGQVWTSIYNFCNPQPPQPPPVSTYCQPQGQQWTSQNTVVSYGDKECVCPPQNTSGGGSNGWTSYGSLNTSYGTQKMCCPTGQSPSGSNNVCCPTGQTGWMSSDNKTTGCCPNGDSPTTGNGDSPSGSNNNLCCPKQSSTYGTLSSGSGIEKGCCPPTQKISFRWHYSGNTGGSTWTSGSWSSTQSNYYGGSWSYSGSMEGALKVTPGTTLKVGYDLTLPGNTSLVDFRVNNPQIVFPVACVSGKPTASTFTVTMPSQAFAFSGSAWYPSGTQSDASVYQGSISVPNLCRGSQLLLNSGGTFSASVS